MPPLRSTRGHRGGYGALCRVVAVAAALLCSMMSAQAVRVPPAYEHYISASAAGAVEDSGTAASKLITSITGAATVVLDGVSFDGEPSDAGEVNGVTLISMSPLRGAAVIAVTAQYASLADDGSSFSDDAYRHLFNLGGISAVIHRDELWVANSAGGSSACSAGADLTGRLGGPQWLANTLSTLEVEISFLGVPRIKINGLNADYPRLRPETETAAHPAPACRMASIPAASMMFLGASGNPFYNDSFAGVIASLAFSFTPPADMREEEVPVPVASPPLLPVSKSDLVVWLDASQGNLITRDASSRVSFWASAAGAQTFSTVASEPVYRAELVNSLPAVDFSASAKMISNAFPLPANGDVTFVWVGQLTPAFSSQPWATLFHHGNHDNDFSLRRNMYAPDHIHFHTLNDNAYNQLPYVIDTPCIYIGTMRGGTVMTLALTVSTGTTSTSYTEPRASMEFGVTKVAHLMASDGDEFTQGYLSELLYFQCVLDTAEIATLRQHLAYKWRLWTRRLRARRRCR
jgi:hypothetical protein